MEAGADGDNSSDEESGDNISGLICDTINEEEDASDADVSTIDMHAKYLESLRSPSNRRMRFGFKIPQVRTFLFANSIL